MNNTPTPNSTSAIAHSIAERYAQLKVGEVVSYSQCSGDSMLIPNMPSLSIEMQGVLVGCRMLGFVEHDAQCIVHAWQIQSERLGAFDIALWPTNASDFGMSAFPRANAFAACPKQLGLYAVLPNAQWIA